MLRTLIVAIFATLALPAFAAVDVNQATQAQLEAVKGVGPALSSRILEARKAGNFKSWADFRERVAGVGESNASRLSKAGLTVAGSGYEPRATAPAAGRKNDAQATRSAKDAPAGKARTAAQ